MIEQKSLPKEIDVIAKTDNNIIMGVQHKLNNLFGLQFHPESIETKFGMKMIENFLEINVGDKLCL